MAYKAVIFLSKRLVLLCIALFLAFFGYAQNGSHPTPKMPEYLPPSPTVANLMNFEEVPVSHYTGQPNISLPIYGKSISKNLSLGVLLSYNTQGIKVNSRSGWTGTGWSIVAGGSISRTVRDVPDESKPGQNGNQTGMLHGQYHYYDSMTSSEKTEFNWNTIGTPTRKYDKEYDLYQFNFMGFAGRFIIMEKPGNPITLEAKLINRAKLFDIDISHDSDYNINAFTIKDNNGYIYTFDVVETTFSTPFGGTVRQGPNPGNISISSSAGITFVNSAWHLSSIETTGGKLLMALEYSDENTENYVSSVSRSWNTITSAPSNLSSMLQNSYNTSIMEPKSSISYNQVSVDSRKLSRIVLRDGTQIEFVPQSSASHPETGGHILDKIIIKDIDGNMFKTYSFDYDTTVDTHIYFGTTYRLWLKGLSETAGGVSNDYAFDYIDKESLPGFDSKESDKWGYFSGIGRSVSSCSTNFPFDENQIQSGLLKSITYPTGGAKEFVFEHNRYSYLGSSEIPYESYINNPLNQDDMQIELQGMVYSHLSDYSSLPIPLNGTVTSDFQQRGYVNISSSVIYNQTGLPDSEVLDNLAFRLVDNNGNGAVLLSINEDCQSIFLSEGNYGLELVQYGGNLSIDDFQISIDDIEFRIAEETSSLRQEMLGGGVRIKEVTFREYLGSPSHQRKISYKYNRTSNSSISSGVVDSENDAMEETYSILPKRYLFAGSENTSASFNPRIIHYDVRQKEAKVNLTQGGFVGYRNVSVSETDNGRTDYEFTSAFDFPSDPQVFNYPHVKPSESIDYKRGLVVKEIVFDENNKVMREISHVDDNGNLLYEFDEAQLFEVRYAYKSLSCEWMQFYGEYDNFESPPNPDQMPICMNGFDCLSFNSQNCGGTLLVTKSDFIISWAKETGKIIKDYFYSGSTQNVIEKRENYEYNDENCQISEKEVVLGLASAPETYMVKYYYPVSSDIPISYSGIGINRLVETNRINEVLVSEQYKDGTKLSETHTNFYEPHTDVVVPRRIRVAKASGSPEDRIFYHSYDSYGNPREVSKQDGMRTSYIWGYNGQYPIAKIEGKGYSQLPGTLVSQIESETDALTLSNLLDSLRNHNYLQNSLVTTYTYDPMVGVTSITDPKGDTQTFEYEEFGRLRAVRDADGNLLSENEYNYGQ